MKNLTLEEIIELIKDIPALTYTELGNKSKEEYIITAFIGIASPFIVRVLHKKRKDLILYLLDEYLKHEKNPIANIIFNLGIAILFIATTIYLYLAQQPIYIILIPSLIVFFISWLLSTHYKKDKKGLVGILSHDFKSVNKVGHTPNNDIFFVEIENKDRKKLSYEERTIITDDKTIGDCVSKIENYYNTLELEINNKIKNKRFKKEHFKVVYNGEETHLCEFMRKVYSKENILEHINRLKSKMSEDNSINFIGDKIGISGYILEKGTLSLDIYLTDHFTFNVFKNIFNEKEIKEIFQTIIRRVNIVNKTEQRYLVKTMKFLFSSFGIDIIVHGITSDKKRAMLLGLRSGKIEKNGECKIHVPVNESFSRTDESGGKYDLHACVKRGIEEELGIPQDLIKDECIAFHDFAMVSDAGEIGLGCYVDLSKIMPLEQARLYPGQDKYMEMDNLLIVPYPPFFWNPDKYIDYFYRRTYNDILTTPWESFTPLLYQRLVIRNMELKHKKIHITFLTFILTLLYILCISNDTDWYNKLIALIASLIISICGTGFWYTLHYLIHRIKIVSFKPLIPQWGGDVKVLQSINDPITNRLNTNNSHQEPKWYFCIKEEQLSKKNSYKLSELKFTMPPLCKARRELSNNKESPIGLYIFHPNDDKIIKSRLFFYQVPIYSKDENNIAIELSIIFDENKNHSYRFIKQIEDPKLNFDKDFDDRLKESYSHLFSLPNNIFSQMKYATIDDYFQKGYQPLDLFQYRGNYYWSFLVEEKSNKDNIEIEINKNTIIYDHCVKEHLQQGKDITLSIKGNRQIVVEKISDFIANKLNRKRTSSLDIYMLQLAFIRKDSNLVLGIKKNKWFCYD